MSNSIRIPPQAWILYLLSRVIAASVYLPVSTVCDAESVKTVVCRAVLARDNAIEILRWFKDDDDAVSTSFLVMVCTS